MSDTTETGLEAGCLCLVTGGGGYLGRELARRLLSDGHAVRVLDVRFDAAAREATEGAEVIEADVRDAQAVSDACRGAAVVFHCAAIIDTTTRAPAAVRERSFSINVGGTQTVIDACLEQDVERLVQTSSINVVFAAQNAGVDESAPLVTDTAPARVDLYSESKARAEVLLLAADGRKTRSGRTLRTCALRPGGIYGPGEPTHLPRLVRAVDSGQFRLKIAGGKGRSDNVYIDDLVEAHLQAAHRLETVGGRAFFVSDGEPSSYFDFFAPLAIALGAPPPKGSVPKWPVLLLVWIAEWLFYLGGPRPFLTHMELDKLTSDQWFSIERAKAELQWAPRIDPGEGVSRCVPTVLEIQRMTPRVQRPHLLWWVSVWGGLGLLFVLAFSDAAYAGWLTSIGPMFSVRVLQIIAAIATLLHVGEGVFAYITARRANLETAFGWGVQTFLLGFPSLRLLLRELKKPGDGAVADPAVVPADQTAI